MKYFIYAFLAFLSCMLFMPTRNSGIRNLPLLILIIALIVAYGLYRLAQLVVFICRIRSKLRNKGMNIQKICFYFRKGYIIAENKEEVFDICLLMRKRNYYRYHFDNINKIEFYKSHFAASKSSGRGTIARGATLQTLVGKQKIARHAIKTDKPVRYFTVINKFPYRITDSVNRQELGNGDYICASEVVLLDLQGFIKFIDN